MFCSQLVLIKGGIQCGGFNHLLTATQTISTVDLRLYKPVYANLHFILLHDENFDNQQKNVITQYLKIIYVANEKSKF